MASFFEFLGSKSLHPAVPHRRPRRLDRPADHRGLRPRHGGRRHHRRLRPLGLGLGLRREAGAQQLHQVDVLLPVHVWRRPARRPVLRQQPGRRRPEVHAAGGRQLRHRPGRSSCSASSCLDLPPGAAGGMLAGSQTMSAAIGSAEEAVNAGVVTLPAGHDARSRSAR